MPDLALKPEIIYKDGKPKSVVMDYGHYKDIIEKLEYLEDLDFIEKRKNDIDVPFEEFFNKLKIEIQSNT